MYYHKIASFRKIWYNIIDELFANTPVHLKKRKENTVMLYLKKITDRFYRELSMTEAIDRTVRGETLTVQISEDVEDGTERKRTYTIREVTKISVREDKILVEADYRLYCLSGWDDNIRKINVAYFEDKTVNRLLLKTIEAMGAVNNGHIVCASDGMGLRTGMIVKFLSNKSFKTPSGSIYEMV